MKSATASNLPGHREERAQASPESCAVLMGERETPPAGKPGSGGAVGPGAAEPTPADNEAILVRGARVHNLKNVDCAIPHDRLTVVTGVSGSGKSSLAFDTIYAEGQRRYVESLSAYARQFLERMEKPDVDAVIGIAPAVAIRQKNATRNPRSTVATATEIYDYLRLLYARVGTTICPQCGAPVGRDTVDHVAARVLGAEAGRRFYVLFPLTFETAEGGRAAPEKTEEKPAAKPLRPSRLGRRRQPGESGSGKSAPAPRAPDERLKERLFVIRQRGFTRLYQEGRVFEFSAPESLLDIDFSRPVAVLVDRLTVGPEIRQRLVDSVELCYQEAGETMIEFVDAGGPEAARLEPGSQRLVFSERFECKRCRIAFQEPEPRLFSFNNPFGACPRCQGFGNTIDFDLDRVIPDKDKSLAEGAVEPWTKPRYRPYFNEMKRAARSRGVRLDVPYYRLTADERRWLLEGDNHFSGIRGFFNVLERKKYKLHVRVFLSRYRGYTLCPECRGGRLRREALNVRINGRTITDVCAMSIRDAERFFASLALSPSERTVADKVLEEVRSRLQYLCEVGLDYLTLDRVASTLSGGESQRIQLATALGSNLVGALYVLDEPSIGLHARDVRRLTGILKSLRDLGNTILVVEHDLAVMREADHVIDLGPGAGEHGGRVIYQGSLEGMVADPRSLTGRYLTGELKIPVPATRRPPGKSWLRIRGARQHNLKSIDVEIPLGLMVCVSGVSGSGKSTLVHDVLYEGLLFRRGNSASRPECAGIEGDDALANVVLVDQSPLGRTPRSNPVTYIKAYDAIRELFAATPEARRRGYSAGSFSFNVPGGRCSTCQGEGTVTVGMQFLADVELVCEECQGKRFKPAILEVQYKGRNIHEVLQMTVREALQFFSNTRKIADKLRVLDEVGLGYLRLGQSATTLSGGEAQRVRLASHLAQQTSQGTLFIFDEPTTGLHFDDINKLLAAFRKLIEGGGTVLIVEHNLDVLKTADWIIDLGPEGGEAGGYVVACGPPETIAQRRESHTGRYLAPYLAKREPEEVARPD